MKINKKLYQGIERIDVILSTFLPWQQEWGYIGKLICSHFYVLGFIAFFAVSKLYDLFFLAAVNMLK